MFGILSMIFRFSGVFLLATVAAIGYGTWHYVKGVINENQTMMVENTRLADALESSERVNKTLRDSINAQNAAIEQMETDAVIRAKKNAAAIVTATAVANKHRARAAGLMKVAPTSTNLCDSSSELLDIELFQ